MSLTPRTSNNDIGRPLPEYISILKSRANQNIQKYLDSSSPKFTRRYKYVLSDDKAARTRPVLAYMVGDALGITRSSIDGLALACELMHNMSLIMDDLPGQDNSDFRRGKQAVHIKFGEGSAQMTALAMLIDAMDIIAQADSREKLSGSLAKHINDCLGSSGMCLGQDEDLATFKKTASLEELDEISYLKTSRVIEMGTAGAALVGKMPEEVIGILKDYSRHFGIAFQAKDDLNDATKTTKEMGKTAGIDAKNEKPTYLSLLGIEGTKQKIALHKNSALKCLDNLPDECDPTKLREIVEYLASK